LTRKLSVSCKVFRAPPNEQMSEPRCIIAVGACAPQEEFRHPLLQGIDKVIPA
jgi:NADH:ubiquinone oxidoreductase subunit B-like Fe-S oxidoreductase